MFEYVLSCCHEVGTYNNYAKKIKCITCLVYWLGY